MLLITPVGVASFRLNQGQALTTPVLVEGMRINHNQAATSSPVVVEDTSPDGNEAGR